MMAVHSHTHDTSLHTNTTPTCGPYCFFFLSAITCLDPARTNIQVVSDPYAFPNLACVLVRTVWRKDACLGALAGPWCWCFSVVPRPSKKSSGSDRQVQQAAHRPSSSIGLISILFVHNLPTHTQPCIAAYKTWIPGLRMHAPPGRKVLRPHRHSPMTEIKRATARSWQDHSPVIHAVHTHGKGTNMPTTGQMQKPGEPQNAAT